MPQHRNISNYSLGSTVEESGTVVLSRRGSGRTEFIITEMRKTIGGAYLLTKIWSLVSEMLGDD